MHENLSRLEIAKTLLQSGAMARSTTRASSILIIFLVGFSFVLFDNACAKERFGAKSADGKPSYYNRTKTSLDTDEMNGLLQTLKPRLRNLFQNVDKQCPGFAQAADPSTMTIRDVIYILEKLLSMPKHVYKVFCDSGALKTIGPDMLDFFDLKMFYLLRPSVLLELKEAFSNDHQSILCKMIRKGNARPEVIKTVENMIGDECSTVLVAKLKGQGDFAETLSRSDKKSFVKNMRKAKPANEWDSDMWEATFKVPDAIDADLIGEMDEENFELSLQSKDLRKGLKRNDQKRAFAEKAKDVLGDVDTWDVADVNKMGDFLLDLDLEDIETIPAEALAAAAESLGKLHFGRGQKAKMIALEQMAVKSLGDAKTWDKAKLKRAASLIKGDRNVLNKLDKDVLEESVADLGKLKFKKGEARFLAKKLRGTVKFKNLTAFTSDLIVEMGNITKGLGAAELDSIPDDAIVGAFDSLKKIDFPHRSQKSTLLKKAQKAGKIKSFDQLTEEDIEDLGDLVEGLTVDDIKEMPVSAIAGTIATLREKKMDRAQKAQIIEKMQSSGDLVDYVGSLGSLVQSIGLKDIQNLDPHDLGLDNDAVPLTYDPLPQQALDMFVKIKEVYGSPSTENGNYTLARMINWGKVAAIGMNKSDIENLMDSESTLNIFESFGTYVDEMSEMQETAIAEKIKEIWKANDAASMSNKTDIDIRKVGKYLKHFSTSELQRLEPIHRATAIQEIGFTSMHNVPPKKLKSLVRFALKHTLRSDDKVVDLTNADSLTSEDLMNVGSLICGLSASDISKLSKDALEEQLYTLGQCPFDSTRMRALYNRAKAIESDLLTSADKLAMAGPVLMYASDDDLAKIDKTALSTSFGIIIEQFDEREEIIKKRQELSFKDMSDQDLNDAVDRKKAFLQLSIDALLSAVTSARRRRETTTLECDQIEALGSAVTSLTTNHIDSIPTADFQNCGESLGEQSGWSKDQLSALSGKAKEVYGDPGTWTTETIRQMGSIVAGLSVSEIEELDLSTIEPLYAIGQHGLLSAAQRKAGVTRWVTLAKSSDYSSISAAELKSIGHFTCGLTSSKIATLNSDAYGGAASVIGTLNSCDASQMSAFASQAKEVYGTDVSSWPLSTITEVGYMVGGFSASEIGSLTADQVDVIIPTVLQHIPAESYAGFSESVLRAMSESQANALSSEQKDRLNDNQLKALISAGLDYVATDAPTTDSGASATFESVRQGLMSLVVVMLLLKAVAVSEA